MIKFGVIIQNDDLHKVLDYFYQVKLISRIILSSTKFFSGHALETMEQLVSEGKKFDLVFIDANKTDYKQYVNVSFEPPSQQREY